MHPITFTEAAEILLDGGVIIFTAENNKQPEEPGFEFEIISFDTLCLEYRKLREDYFNIQLYTL
jgi:hypothetical protein